MSGGVGPTGDSIRLPGDVDEPATTVDEQSAKLSTDPLNNNKKKTLDTNRALPVERHRFLSLRQLNALAAIIVLAASGLVHPCDAAFALFSVAYVYFIATFAFPAPSSTSSPEPPVFGERNRVLGLYVSVGALLGLLLPAIYILNGMVSVDKKGIQAAAPHFFLLASQVFMEGVTFSRSFSLPVRAFVPVLYNGKRMFALADWLRAELGKEPGAEPEWRLLLGRSLAIANLVFWGFNLFGFLIPVYLPRALKRHYAKIISTSSIKAV